jgi:hypothetical protein
VVKGSSPLSGTVLFAPARADVSTRTARGDGRPGEREDEETKRRGVNGVNGATGAGDETKCVSSVVANKI